MSPTDLSTLNPAQKRALLARRLAATDTADQPRHAPLSLAQQRLWFIDQMQPGQPVYSIAAALDLDGPLDRARLGRALDHICARHETLRTRFADQNGAPIQIVERRQRLEVEDGDLSSVSPKDQQARLTAFAQRAFDLTNGPLVRCAVFRTAPGQHVLAFAVHHIIADYRSLQVMIAELVALYEGRTLPPLTTQYADYAIAERGRAKRMQAQQAYWKDRLAGLPGLIDLPLDHPRPAQQDFTGATHAFALPPALSAAIEAFAQSRGLTPFTVLLAGFQALLTRLSGSPDICCGTTVTNRNRAELQGLVGYFVNTLALRCAILTEDSFASLATRVGEVTRGALGHADVPFEQVVDACATARSLSHTPLFQVMFNLHEKQPDRFACGDLVIRPKHLGRGWARFDLSLDMFQGEGGISGVIEYATALFEPQTIERMGQYLVRLLEAGIADPEARLSAIPLLSAAEQTALARANRADRPIPKADLASLLRATAETVADRPAVIAGPVTLTHGQLHLAADQLAARIAPHLRPGARVAICLSRSADMVVALLAALRLGAPYIPLDPTHPPERLKMILEDADPDLLVVAGAGLVDAPCPVLDLCAEGGETPPCPTRTIGPDDLAYVIFTSGTTGRPKGVPIQQRSLVNLLTSMAETPGMTATDRLIAVTTPAFDIAALELFLPLLTGGTLVLADSEQVADGQALAGLIRASGATMMQATPATWRLLVETGWQAPDGFRMLCGGEALDPTLARALLAGDGTLWNLYGPTETTIWSAVGQITQKDCERGLIPLGQPVANTSLKVIDASGGLCPPGVPGELWIGGAGLSPGYLNRPDLTADRFVTHQGERMYRTGDRVRLLPDGRMAYLGRSDFQIKLRGFRIEPAEIEAHLTRQSGVDQALVALHGTGDTARLVAWLRGTATAADLRAELTRNLPAYMIPSDFVLLDRFPLNANGKVDRARLPAPGGVHPDNMQPPETDAEVTLARLWAELLGVEAVHRDTNFFAAGGHSLLAMRMVARLAQAGPRAVPLRLLFEKPCLGDYAAALDSAGLLQALPCPPIPKLAPDTSPPLSLAQERQWTLARLDPGHSAYNIPTTLRLNGAVDADRLARAFDLVHQRHAILRAAYPEDAGRPRAVQTDHAADFRVVDCDPAKVDALLATEAQAPFDLSSGPLARLRLLRVGKGETVLLLVLHHIVADAPSVDLLLRELLRTYGALAEDEHHSPPPLPVQYGDYAAWQRAQDPSDQISYWQKALSGAPALLDLPTDFPRPAVQDHRGGSVDFTIDQKTAKAIHGIAGEANATPFMVMITLYAHFLGRYARVDDVVIGTPVTSRPHPDLEDLVGLFVNTLALRLPVTEGATLHDALTTCRALVLDGFANQDAPFERVVDALSIERSWSHNPVFQTMFAWRQQSDARREGIGGLSWEPLVLDSTNTKTDLFLSVLDRGSDLALRLEYRRDLFLPETIRHLALSFTALVQAAVHSPDQPLDRLSLMHPDQAKTCTGRVCPSKTLPQPATLHDRVAAQATLTPGRIAVEDGAHRLTYAALDQRSNTLAHALQARGIGPGQRVGVALGRRVDLVVALLAVLRTGAAYVPLDPAYPADRIAFIACDADLSLTLSDGPGAGVLDLSVFWDGAPGVGDTHGGLSPRPEPSDAGGDDLAYLIYTSGSTGLPKGVALEHRNACALIDWAATAFSGSELSGVLASTSVCFDLSVFEIFVPLCTGGTVFVVDNLFGLADAPFADQVTLVNTVPTPMAELLRLGPLPGSVRTVCLAGEPLPAALADRIHALGDIDVWNLYGPSEDTTYSTAMRLPRDGGFNIGWPVAGAQAHVLDSRLQPLPPGFQGELFLSGAGVGRGYWNRPDLTTERFLSNPFDTDGSAPVMYRTGDRVRRRADGSLDYLGRGDTQVKLRGFRIEPGEIEATLTRLDGVGAALVAVWTGPDGRDRLTAWAETTRGKQDLRDDLSRLLPAYLVPTSYVLVDKLPRLPNGKLDRNALPAPDIVPEPKAGHPATPPAPGLETQLAAIWRQVLGRDGIGRDDGFFSIGGDSILAIQVVAQARAAGIPLTPRDLFQFPTIARLAEAATGRTALTTDSGPVEGPQTLTAIQRWFLARDLPAPHHWNQAIVLRPTRPLNADLLARSMAHLAKAHDALRARFHRTAEGWVQDYAPVGLAPLPEIATGDVTAAAARMQAGFDLGRGPLWGAVLCHTPEGQRLAIAAHHLIVDGVSWRILMADLEQTYEALENGQDLPPLRRSTSPAEWTEFLADHPAITAQSATWQAAMQGDTLHIPTTGQDNTEASAQRIETRLPPALTKQVLEDVPANYPVKPQEVLLAALGLSLRDVLGPGKAVVEMESHGRGDLSETIDLSRSVGWLTALFPVALTLPEQAEPLDLLRKVKDTLRHIPDDGVGYGVLRHVTGALTGDANARIRFNYLGQVGGAAAGDGLFRPAPESAGPTSAPENPRDVPLEINALVPGDHLKLVWTFTGELNPPLVETLSAGFASHLAELVRLCLAGEDAGFTPADFPEMDFGQDDLDDLLNSL